MNASKLQNIFITHLHGDHLFGLPGLLASLSFTERDDPITVFGPSGLKAYLETCFQLSHTFLNYPLQLIEIEEGVIFSDDLFTVETIALQHRVPCYGYRITERTKPRALNVTRLKADGIKPGPLFSLLKQGNIVQLDDGRIINGSDYLSPAHPGKVIAIFGDTVPTPQSLLLAKDADVVVHEATFEAALQDKANNLGHSTTVQAAMIAKESGAKQLIITHISSRYSEQDNQCLLDECRAIFPDTKIANDFFSVQI